MVFNAKTVRAPATRAEPKQFPIGIEYVIVNGKVVVDANVQNETLAGRVKVSHPAARNAAGSGSDSSSG